MPTSDLVKERRLRPIYELLDAGYNKKVIQEVDRLLKKSPNFTCAKVLKGLAILRLGNRAECLAIISPIFDEVPTEDSTIQALSICYRELEEPARVCQLLENACKVDKSEELMSLCFMANVRISDYQKQHQIALNLYKLYNKGPYFSWAIMSLYAKAIRDQKNDPNKISLPLAERMMAKFIEDNNIGSEQDILLHFYILRHQGNFEKVLEILDGPLKRKAASELSFLHEYRTEGLAKLKKFEELGNYLEGVILKNMDEWKLYRDYIENSEHIGRKRVGMFLEERLALILKEEKIPCKSLLLAHLLLLQSGNDQKGDYMAIFDLFLTNYSNKPSFFMDMYPFFNLVKKDETEKILSKMKSMLKNPSSFVEVDDVQREINYVYIIRFLLSGSILDSLNILDHVFLYVEKYLDARDQQVENNVTYSGKEGLPQDDFLFIGAMMLLETVWKSSSCMWEDLVKKSSLRSSQGNEKRKERREDSNGRANGNTTAGRSETEEIVHNGLHSLHLDSRVGNFSIPQEEVPIFLALAILEYGLHRSPNNPQFRLLLAKTYFRCGAANAAMTVIGGLDLKHVQWESLGYLHLWKIRASGLLSETARAFLYAENFYTSYQKESMEHVLTAYKFGSWDKVLEFLDFRDTLTNSIQYGLIKLERQLLELLIRGNNQAQAIQFSQNFVFNLEKNYEEKLEVFRDCRDISVLMTYSQTRTTEEELSLSKQADIHRILIRGLIQSILASLISTLDLPREDEKFIEAVELAKKHTVLLREHLNTPTPQFDLNPPIDGVWPPRINEYKSSRSLKLLMNFFNLTLSLLEDPEKNLSVEGPKTIELLQQTIQDEGANWAKLKESIFQRSDLFEDVFNFIEAFSFAIILMDVCKSMIKKSGAIGGKGKRRRYKELSKETDVGREFNKVVIALTEFISTTEMTLESIGLVGKARYPTNWVGMESFWTNLVSYDLINYILPFSMNRVMENLNNSYGRALAELLNLFRLKTNYLESLLISS